MESFDSVAGSLSWTNSMAIFDSLRGVTDVYHYTSVNCLKDILLKKTFQADDPAHIEQPVVSLMLSDIRCLNDYSESQNAVEMFREVCREMKSNHTIQEGFYDQIIRLEPQDTLFLFVDPKKSEDHGTEHYGIKFSPYYRFVGCFSQENDLLSMWRYYLKNSRYEGYNICLLSDALEKKRNRYHGTQYNVNIVRLVYKDSEKKSMIYNVLDKLNRVWNPSVPVSRVEQPIREHLWTWGLMFKHYGFHEEKEVRIVVDVPVNGIPSATPVSDALDKIEIQYRLKNGRMTPYIILNFPKDDLDSVMIGPFSNDPYDKKAQEESVYRYMTLKYMKCCLVINTQ